MSEEGSLGEPQGTGIVLRRKKREDNSPTKAGDALAIAELVQKLCQVAILKPRSLLYTVHAKHQPNLLIS